MLTALAALFVIVALAALADLLIMVLIYAAYLLYCWRRRTSKTGIINGEVVDGSTQTDQAEE